MGLFDNHNAELKDNYFTVWEVVKILFDNASYDEPWHEVGQFLGHIEAKYVFKLYVLNDFKIMSEFSDEGYLDNPIDTLIKNLMETFFLYDDEFETSIERLEQKYSNFYWEKEEIYCFEMFNDLNLFEKLKEEHSNYIVPYSAQIRSLNDSLKVMTDSNLKLREKLRESLLHTHQLQIEKQTLNDQKSNMSLLSAILDSNSEYYAPDLALAVQLWEHLYVTNINVNDSHTNNSSKWIKQNTNYDLTKSSANRIREIVTPLTEWGGQRSKP